MGPALGFSCEIDKYSFPVHLAVPPTLPFLANQFVIPISHPWKVVSFDNNQVIFIDMPESFLTLVRSGLRRLSQRLERFSHPLLIILEAMIRKRQRKPSLDHCTL